METSIILRGKAGSREHADMIRLMLSDDRSVFEKGLDSALTYFFQVRFRQNESSVFIVLKKGATPSGNGFLKAEIENKSRVKPKKPVSGKY